MDPSMKLFEFSEKSLLASIPTMLAFPKVLFLSSHMAYSGTDDVIAT